ncbi:unnamed protein product [Prorocentrum cordatum]|uniref:Uncharacterized protein n=1 Tax=Prorocentrum cordatum TaxID=2364126 RepID=A0ABN9PXH6_9DINO|nr:unnamed protein product [Polarella glacialis]
MPALKPATLRPTLNSAHAAAALVPNAPQQTKPAPRQTRGELCDRGGACPGGRGALPEACLNKRRGDRWAPADFSVDLYYRLDLRRTAQACFLYAPCSRLTAHRQGSRKCWTVHDCARLLRSGGESQESPLAADQNGTLMWRSNETKWKRWQRRACSRVVLPSLISDHFTGGGRSLG